MGKKMKRIMRNGAKKVASNGDQVGPSMRICKPKERAAQKVTAAGNRTRDLTLVPQTCLEPLGQRGRPNLQHVSPVPISNLGTLQYALLRCRLAELLCSQLLIA